MFSCNPLLSFSFITVWAVSLIINLCRKLWK